MWPNVTFTKEILNGKLHFFVQWYFREDVARRCSIKKLFLKISKNTKTSSWTRLSFLIKFIKREASVQRFSCEFCKMFQSTYFVEHLQTAASDFLVFYLVFVIEYYLNLVYHIYLNLVILVQWNLSTADIPNCGFHFKDVRVLIQGRGSGGEG